jgi:WD40 repeat protein
LSSIDSANEMILRGTTGAFDCITFSLDGSQIAAGANSGDVYIWSAADGAQRARLNQLRGPIAAIGFIAPPLSYTTSAQSSGFGDDSSSKPQEVIEQAPTRLLAVLQDGGAAIWTWPLPSEPTVTSNWNVLTGSSERGSHPLMDARLDPGARWLACADTNEVRLWDVTVDPPLEMKTAQLKPREAPYAVAIDSIPSWCAVGQINGDITVLAARH